MIKSLQSLRFLMALMIFHHHFFTDPQVVQFGTFPVSFFFILSGFVMTLGYFDRVNSDNFSYKAFLKKRLIKLLPLNAVCLALWMILPFLKDIVNGEITISTYLFAIPDLLLVQAWVPIKQVYWSGNAVAWFLSDMLFCYIMFPVLVRILSKNWGKVIMLVLVATYLWAVSFINGDSIHALIYISPFFRIIDFMLGITVSLTLPTIIKEAHKPILSTTLEVSAIALVVFSIVIYPYIPSQYRVASLYWIPSIIMILSFVVSAKWGGYFSIILSKPFLVYLGTLSFPFYMIHKILIDWYKIVEIKVGLVNYPVVGALICVVITTAMAHIYVKRVEPLLLLKLRKR